MYLSIFGFLADIDDDDSLKFELHLDESLNAGRLKGTDLFTLKRD